MNQITFNLIVIHSQDLEISKKFYETLGICFLYEQHGSGKKHLSGVLEGVVFEIYPRSDDVDTSVVRLGFRVSSVDKAIEDLEKIGLTVLSPPKDSEWGRRAVILDPNGYKIELVN
ncbi:MAG: VOC family protein [Cyanobacteria bacterium P01_D01_bin.50]